MKKELLLKYAMVISIMLLIYAFSSQPATESKALSDQFLTVYHKIVEQLDCLPDDIRGELFSRPSHYIRKFAHLIIYALLGAVTLVALWQTSLRRGLCGLIALMVCTVYALTDEWHQYYVAGRGAQLSDVYLDSVGALIGILGIVILRHLIQRIIRKHW